MRLALNSGPRTGLTAGELQGLVVIGGLILIGVGLGSTPKKWELVFLGAFLIWVGVYVLNPKGVVG